MVEQIFFLLDSGVMMSKFYTYESWNELSIWFYLFFLSVKASLLGFFEQMSVLHTGIRWFLSLHHHRFSADPIIRHAIKPAEWGAAEYQK